MNDTVAAIQNYVNQRTSTPIEISEETEEDALNALLNDIAAAGDLKDKGEW